MTTGDVAYCWGANVVGQLGDGTTTPRLQPTLVKGGLRFRHVSAGIGHACGLTTDNRVYCCGLNQRGAIGDSTTTDRHVPVPIYGGRHWLQVRAGNNRTCALTQANVTFCWGWNIGGSLGITSLTVKRVLIPSRVSGTLKFARLTGRNFPVCGTLTSGKAYCWGLHTPAPVTGGLVFTGVSTGTNRSSCAVTTTFKAYCWGEDTYGQLGTGTTAPSRPVPTAVGGGTTFQGVTVGNKHTCGVARSTNLGYCWGLNDGGQLGDGGNASHFLPFPVAPPS